jgi:hypothetical protein
MCTMRVNLFAAFLWFSFFWISLVGRHLFLRSPGF